MCNHGPFSFRHFAELRAHFEPTSESEGVEDTDEVEDDYPPADLAGSDVPAAHGGSCVPSAGAPQPHQQHLSLQLGELRQETNRWAGVGR